MLALHPLRPQKLAGVLCSAGCPGKSGCRLCGVDEETEGCVRCGVMTRSRCQACVNPLCGPCTGYPHETLYFLVSTPAPK